MLFRAWLWISRMVAAIWVPDKAQLIVLIAAVIATVAVVNSDIAVECWGF